MWACVQQWHLSCFYLIFAESFLHVWLHGPWLNNKKAVIVFSWICNEKNPQNSWFHFLWNLFKSMHKSKKIIQIKNTTWRNVFNKNEKEWRDYVKDTRLDCWKTIQDDLNSVRKIAPYFKITGEIRTEAVIELKAASLSEKLSETIRY